MQNENPDPRSETSPTLDALRQAVTLAVRLQEDPKLDVEDGVAELPEFFRGIVRGAAEYREASRGFPRFDGYDVVDVAGSGGMGTVYKAYQFSLGRPVALKVVDAGAFSGDRRQRARNEAEAMAELDHANLLGIHELILTERTVCMVLPWIGGGRTLATVIEDPARETDLDDVVSRGARMISGVARALDYLHAKGWLHRDVKPENVLVKTSEDGEELALLADFGIAVSEDRERLTETGEAVGTARYIAPEQAAGKEVDARADVFSLGVCLFELLAGRLEPPKSPLELLEPHRRFRRSLLPEGTRFAGLNAVARLATQSDPAHRFTSAGELADALDAWSEGRPVRVPGVPLAAQVTAFTRTHKKWLAAAAMLAFLGGGWALARQEGERNLAAVESILAGRETIDRTAIAGRLLVEDSAATDDALESWIAEARARVSEEGDWQARLEEERAAVAPGGARSSRQMALESIMASIDELSSPGLGLIARAEALLALEPSADGTRVRGIGDRQAGWASVYLRALAPRAAWEARVPSRSLLTESSEPRDRIALSVEETDLDVEVVARSAQDRALDEERLGDVDTHFFVAPDGRILQGRELRYRLDAEDPGAISITVLRAPDGEVAEGARLALQDLAYELSRATGVELGAFESESDPSLARSMRDRIDELEGR